MRTLVVDNYDSFTFNLVQALQVHGADCRVVRSDTETVDELLAWEPERIVLSPGPFGPERTGVCVALVERSGSIPVLGICLGMQVIATTAGARIVESGRPVHGKARSIVHDGSGCLRDIPSPTEVGLYHSLIVAADSFGEADLVVFAHSADGVVMGVRLPDRPVEGLLFHPESFLTPHGNRMIENFVEGSDVE